MIIILFSCITIVVITISYGIINLFKKEINKDAKKVLKINISLFMFVMTMAIMFLIPNAVEAATKGNITSDNGLGYLAAALSTGIASLGSGYAVASTGSSAIGAISEEPKILGKTLIFVGLAEGIAIYGLIISLMILSKL